MRTTPTKVLEMFLDLPTRVMAAESAAPMASYHRLPRPDTKNPGIECNRIWAKADKMNQFSLIKDHVALRRAFGNQIVIPTREEWDKDWHNRLRKNHSHLDAKESL